MLFKNTKQRLSSYHGYSPGTENIMVFDRYDDVSAKDHERIRRGGEGSTSYNLTVNSSLPNRDAIELRDVWCCRAILRDASHDAAACGDANSGDATRGTTTVRPQSVQNKGNVRLSAWLELATWNCVCGGIA